MRFRNFTYIAVCSLFLISSCSLFKPQKTESIIVEPTPPPVVPTLPVAEQIVKYAPKGKIDPELMQVLEKDLFVKNILSKPEDYNVQIIYASYSGKSKNLSNYKFLTVNADPEFYFYPASMVKLPIAVMALHKINELKASGIDIDKNYTMLTYKATDAQTEVFNDPTSADGKPSIAQYIKNIMLTSDNDASNRLYEFVGQEYLNNKLKEFGFTSAEIRHRLSIPLSANENRFTNPIKFMDSTGKIVYEQSATKSDFKFAKRNTTRGKGYMSGGKLVNKPFDFSEKNRFSLTDLHDVVMRIVDPNYKAGAKNFNLTPEDRNYLLKYMSMYPSESRFPTYNPNEVWDSYVKFNVLGSEKNAKIEKGLRIFNKVGFAYGYITDASYVANFDDGVNFFLSVTIYANNDHVFNDDKYNTDDIAMPFMKKVGQLIYDYEKKKNKSEKFDLNALRLDYTE